MMIMYQTFWNMIQSFQDFKIRNAITFFWNYFLVDFGHKIKVTANINSVEYLTVEEILVSEEEFETFKLFFLLVC